jgi:hypothetical protein
MNLLMNPFLVILAEILKDQAIKNLKDIPVTANIKLDSKGLLPIIKIRACGEENDVTELLESLDSQKNQLETQTIPLNPQKKKILEEKIKDIEQQFGVRLLMEEKYMNISGSIDASNHLYELDHC